MQYTFKNPFNDTKMDQFLLKLMGMVAKTDDGSANWDDYHIKFTPNSLDMMFDNGCGIEYVHFYKDMASQIRGYVISISDEEVKPAETYVPTDTSEEKLMELVYLLLTGSDKLMNETIEKVCKEQLYDPKYLTLMKEV